MQISKKSIMVDIYGPRGFFCRAQWAGLVCEISSHLDLKSEGRGLSKIAFWALITVPPFGWLHSCFLGSTCTSFSVIGPSVMVLAHSSWQQLKPLWQTTNNNKLPFWGLTIMMPSYVLIMYNAYSCCRCCITNSIYQLYNHTMKY